MEAKALANEKLIKEKNIDLVSIQFRASDEGVRSKTIILFKRKIIPDFLLSLILPKKIFGDIFKNILFLFANSILKVTVV